MQNYKIESKINEGGFGSIYLAKNKKSDKVVLKKIKSVDITKIEDYPSEVFFLNKCRVVKNVIRMITFFEHDAYIYIVMEHLDNYTDLFDLITGCFPLDEKVIKSIFTKIVETCVDMAAMNIYHCDIKDENVVLGYSEKVVNGNTIPSKIRLIDFGNARYGNALDQPFHPTTVYCPPEYTQNGMVSYEKFTVWTLGCLLYNLIYSFLPIDEENLKGPIIWPKSTVSYQMVYTAKRCLKQNPSERVSLQNLLSMTKENEFGDTLE